jgi:hypothetical protein
MTVTKEGTINAVALVVTLLYCAFPVLLSLSLFKWLDGPIVDLMSNYLSVGDASPLNALLVPVLGAITIFKSESIRLGLSTTLLAVLVVAFCIVFFGYVSALGDDASTIVPAGATDTTAAAGSLKGFLETTSLQILVLLGLREAATRTADVEVEPENDQSAETLPEVDKPATNVGVVN